MARKRAAEADAAAPVAKRRSSRQAAAASQQQQHTISSNTEPIANKVANTVRSKSAAETAAAKIPPAGNAKRAGTAVGQRRKVAASPSSPPPSPPIKETSPAVSKQKNTITKSAKKSATASSSTAPAPAPISTSSRAVSEDPDPDTLPDVNPEAPRHEGEWYWLMKAEPETRMENGHDVRFSIDDLRAKTKPEGWDGIRNYSARNHMRNMNVGDKAFFYHSNCKEPAIVGTMEIVKEFSEDKSARRPGTPYHDPKPSSSNRRWSLVHVSFLTKFAVPIYLKELKEMGKDGGPLAEMQMLRMGRLSVSRVSGEEWKTLMQMADRKAEEEGLEHETGRV